MQRITARVPATVANLGPGFDCLGMAVGLYVDVTMEIDGERTGMEITGEGCDRLPSGRSNLARRAIGRYCDAVGLPVPNYWLRMHNRIPVSGGLGGSAAAIVAGLLLANEYAEGQLGQAELLELATEIEGHPDNVGPALTGGLLVTTVEDGRVVSQKVPLPPQLRGVVFVPDFAMPTAEARRILPHTVHRRQAIFNISRTATLVAAMYSGRLDLLGLATQDQLHQTYRQQMFPAMPRFFEAALSAGALGAFLCGAGPALMALTSGGEEEVMAAFQRTSEAEDISGRVGILELCDRGGEVWREAPPANPDSPLQRTLPAPGALASDEL
ncbi:MAG: homoserine kinase [Chloroflexi bacterium]|nr:homoserine kinase [Chloroflexota bacterium]